MSDSEDVFNFVPMGAFNQRNPSATTRKRAHEESINFIKTQSAGVKIVKIEIFDPNVEPKVGAKICECRAEKCVQYVAKSLIMDDVYRKVLDLIAEISDSIKNN